MKPSKNRRKRAVGSSGGAQGRRARASGGDAPVVEEGLAGEEETTGTEDGADSDGPLSDDESAESRPAQAHLRLLLRAFENRRKEIPSYTRSQFADDVGLSGGGLSLVLNGKRGLSSKVAQRLVTKLGLNDEEENAFLRSVSLAERLARGEPPLPSHGASVGVGSSSLPTTRGSLRIAGGATMYDPNVHASPDELAKKEKIRKARALIERSVVRNYRNKRLVVTTVVQGAEVDLQFLAAIENFCARNDAELVILTVRNHLKTLCDEDTIIDPVLMERHAKSIWKNIQLNPHLTAVDAGVKPQSSDPLAGFQHYGARRGESYIFAHTTQRLKPLPHGFKKMARVQWTTGALSLPLYRDDRNGIMANARHTLGALIVEIRHGRFHIRNIRAADDGSFCDIAGDGMAMRYSADGSVSEVRPALVRGDEHGGPDVLGDPEANRALDEMTEILQPTDIVLHDLFDAKSISHHNRDILQKADLPPGCKDLPTEISGTTRHLAHLSSSKPADARLIVVGANHNEHFMKWVADGRWFIGNLPRDYLMIGSAALYSALHEGDKNPLKKVIDPQGTFAHWANRGEEIRIHGVMVSAHGDEGINGARGNLKQDAVAHGEVVTGHSHSPQILGLATQVGTTSLLDMGYNHGPSTWAHACALIYPGGQVQLVFMPGGEWRLSEKDRQAAIEAGEADQDDVTPEMDSEVTKNLNAVTALAQAQQERTEAKRKAKESEKAQRRGAKQRAKGASERAPKRSGKRASSKKASGQRRR